MKRRRLLSDVLIYITYEMVKSTAISTDRTEPGDGSSELEMRGEDDEGPCSKAPGRWHGKARRRAEQNGRDVPREPESPLDLFNIIPTGPPAISYFRSAKFSLVVEPG